MAMAALSSYNDPASSSRSSLSASYRERKLHELLANAVPDTSGEPDPDRMDLQDFKFLPGDVVALYDRKRDEAEQWRVVTVLDEMVSLQCLAPDHAAKGQLRWQACATDKLLLGDTYRQLSRTRVRQELLEQRQASQAARAQAAAAARAEADEDMPEDRRGAAAGVPRQRPSGQGAQGAAGGGSDGRVLNRDLGSDDEDEEYSDDEHGGDPAYP